MYNVIRKILEDENMKKEEMDRILEFSNSQGVDTTKLYLGHVVFVDDSMQISKVDEPFKIFSDCSFTFVGNRMFWDIINQEVFGDINGFNGDLLPGERNTGFCVDSIQVLYDVTKKQRMTLEELNLFIGNYNVSNSEKMIVKLKNKDRKL